MTFATMLMLALLPGLLVGSAFFSGSETALFSLTRHQRARLARETGVTGQTITTLLAETRHLLITLLLSNMTVNVLFFVISSVLLIQLQRETDAGAVLMTAASLAPLLTISLLGEVLPKLIAARLTVQWARTCALPLFVVHRAIAPVRLASSALIITPLARLTAPTRRPAELTTDELASLLNLSQRQGVIDPDEQRLLQQVLELGQLKVRDLMVPRVDIQAFDLQDEPAELVRLLREARLSQVPVYDGDLDNIVGRVVARQVLLRPPKTPEALKRLIRPVKFVPEQQRADQLLVELRKTGHTFAIVVDEYGGTAGLITIEDLVEHMVGDIPGPYEQAGEPEVEALGPGLWRVDADLSVHEWAEVFGHNAAVEGLAELEMVSTLGGLMMARLGRVPRPGDQTAVGNVQITVDRMDGLRIQTLLVELKPQPVDKAGAAGRSADPSPEADAS